MGRGEVRSRGRALLLALAQGLALVARSAGAGDCRVLDFGATPDDASLDTAAIQRAIDACSGPARGRVVVDGGRFVSGTLFLRGGTDLHVAGTATLEASPDLADYPVLDGSEAGAPEAAQARGRLAFLVARDAENVRITGYGRLEGRGEAFWGPGFLDSGLARPSRPRPFPWIWLRGVKGGVVRDVTLTGAPGPVLACDDCEDLRVEGVRIFSDLRSPNTDGIQIHGGRRILIRGVFIRTGDDAIVLKASRGPVEDVIVSDCFLTSDDAGFKLGTGSASAVRRVTVSNVHVLDSRYGFTLFMKDGGTYEDIVLRDVVVAGDAPRHPTQYALFFDVDRRTPEAALGRIRNVRVEGLRVATRGNILVQGHPLSPIEGLLLRDVRVRVERAVDLAALGGKPRGNATLRPVAGAADYSREDGHVVLGHVRDVRVEGLDLDAAPGSARTGLVLRDVTDGALSRVRGRGDFAGRPLVDARGARDVTLRGSRAAPGSIGLVRVPEGEPSLRLEGNEAAERPQSVTSR